MTLLATRKALYAYDFVRPDLLEFSFSLPFVIKYWIFVLQTEKVDLENTVVDESQRQWKDVGPSTRLRQDKYSGMTRFVFVFVLLWYILFQIVAIGKTESRLSYFFFVLRFLFFNIYKCYSICSIVYDTLLPVCSKRMANSSIWKLFNFKFSILPLMTRSYSHVNDMALFKSTSFKWTFGMCQKSFLSYTFFLVKHRHIK